MENSDLHLSSFALVVFQLYECGVHRHVCDITSDTAESFRFSLQQFLRKEALAEDGGVQLADGGWLIPSSDGTAGKEQFYRFVFGEEDFSPRLMRSHQSGDVRTSAKEVVCLCLPAFSVSV